MTIEHIIDTVKFNQEFETQENLIRLTIILNPIFKNGYQLSYYYKYFGVTEENIEFISYVETLIYASLSEAEFKNYTIRSAIYFGKHELLDGENIIYERDFNSSIE